MREIYDIVQKNSQGFSTATDRMAAVTVVPDIPLYTQLPKYLLLNIKHLHAS